MTKKDKIELDDLFDLDKMNAGWIELYNSCSNGRSGFEKLLNVQVGLKSVKESTFNIINNEIEKIIIKHEAPDPFSMEKSSDTSFVELTMEVMSSWYTATQLLRLNFLSNSSSFKDFLKDGLEFEFKEQVVKEVLDLLDSFSEVLVTYYSAKNNLKVIETIVIPKVVFRNFSTPLLTELIEEEKKKTLDIIERKHVHRRIDIVNKYNESKDKNPHMNDSEIRGLVQSWYMSKYDKNIDEGLIRYYLGLK